MPAAKAKLNTAPKPSFKIGEVAKQSGVSIETLRFYERRGLLGQPMRTNSGYRMYDHLIINRLSFIKRAQTLGFSLDEIAALIKIKSDGQSPCDEVRALVRNKIRDVNDHIKNLMSYRDELAANLKEWEKLGKVDGHVCGLIERLETGNSRQKVQRKVRR